MTQGLSQQLYLSQGLVLSQQMELSQKLALVIEGLRGLHPPNEPGNVLGKILEGLISQIPKEELCVVFANITDAKLRESIVKSIEVFAVPTADKVRDFSIRYLFQISTDTQGRFVHALDEHGERLLDPPRTDLGNLTMALLKPEQLDKQITSTQDVLKSQSKSGRDVSFEGLNLMLDARTIAPHLKQPMTTLTNILLFFLTRKDEGGCYVLKEFALDCVVLEKLDIIISERIQRRFVRRFKCLRPGSGNHHYEECMLNTIAELALISLGVISPEIFTIKRGEVDSELLSLLDDKIDYGGMSLKQAFRHYRLRDEGTFFWNRYSTLTKRPCRVTDEIIRRFIAETVRQNRPEVLVAINFVEFFSKLTKSVSSVSDTDEREIILREKLIELVENDEFQEKFVLLLKRWYKHLCIFYA